MLPLLAELTTEARELDGRRAVRRSLRLEVEASSLLNSARVLIRDLSEQGLLIETAAHLAIGETIEVYLPEAGAREARIKWTKGLLFGCEFTAPVSKAAVSAALLLAPIEQAPISAHAGAPAQSAFSEHARPGYDYDRGPESNAMNIALMASLGLALAMVALFLYALLTLQFSV